MANPDKENQSSKKRRVACYVRVSTNLQQGGMESQTRALTEFCQRNGITDYEIFTDEGISGAKQSRPALDRMMGVVRTGEIERVVVWSFSRFARSTTHLLHGLEEMKKYNCRFLSISEQIDTESPLGKALFTLIGALAQLERELICERVKMGLHNARMKGKLIGRKKTRNSELIRALLKKGLPYRLIASLSGASHGSVWAEKKCMLKEEDEKAKLLAEEKQKKKEAEAAILGKSDVVFVATAPTST